MARTKAHGQKHQHDKFYTQPHVAESCLSLLSLDDYSTIIEPSAGNGSFLRLLPGRSQGFDISPEHPSIIEQDFFSYTQERLEGRTLVVGNPPFGQQNSLSIRFINHASSFADTIAFILPISFMKQSVQRRISKNLHLHASHVLPKNSFAYEGNDYHVPCVFQIWEHDNKMRIDPPSVLTSSLFDFVKKTENPHVSIRRIGGRSGKASLDLDVSEQSNHFLRLKIDMTPQDFCDMVNRITFSGRDYGVGPRTLGKGELIDAIEKEYQHENIV